MLILFAPSFPLASAGFAPRPSSDGLDTSELESKSLADRADHAAWIAGGTASGTSRVTTLPAPITGREAMLTPARIIAPPPTHLGPDVDRFAVLLPPALRRVERMQRRVYLHRGSEQGEISDPDATDVEHDAVEIEEHSLAKLDVGSVIAVKRW